MSSIAASNTGLYLAVHAAPLRATVILKAFLPIPASWLCTSVRSVTDHGQEEHPAALPSRQTLVSARVRFGQYFDGRRVILIGNSVATPTLWLAHVHCCSSVC